MSQIVLDVKNIEKKFSLDAGFFARKDKFVYAVNDVSFTIEKGKTYGLVGESGCGKSTTARLLMGMYKIDAGEILFYDSSKNCDNVLNVEKLSKKELKLYREKVKYVFQDPGRSLNPRMTILQILLESYRYSKSYPGKENAVKEAKLLMNEVGLSENDLEKRPSEFSGGQRQRISIARGLIQKPEVLICDEVVSALDVSVQAQILNLLSDIRENRKLSMLFIAHDLKVACYFCDKIGVMYRGVMVEEGEAADFYKEALHPYTKLLFETSQLLSSTADGSSAVKNSEIKMLTETLEGCPFAHRCTKCTEKCKKELPPWKIVSADGEVPHKVRCWKI